MFDKQYEKLELIGEILGLLRHPSKNSSLLVKKFISYLGQYDSNFQLAKTFLDLLDEDVPKDVEQLVHYSGKDANTVRAILRALTKGGAAEVEKGGANRCKNFYFKKRKNPIPKSAKLLEGIEDNPWNEQRTKIYNYYRKKLSDAVNKQVAIRQTAHRFRSGFNVIIQLIDNLENSAKKYSN